MCLVLGACDSGKKEKQTTNSLDKTIEVATASAIAAPALGLTVARSRHTATLLPNGEVLFAGGASEDTSSSVEVFDPKTNTFDVPGELDPVTKGGTVTQMSDGKLLFVGGKIDQKTVNGFATLYDAKTGKFARTGSPISKRFDHEATLLGNGMVLIVGGTGSDGYPLKNAEIYDPNSSTFKPAGMLTTGRSRTSATLLPNGRVLITGGIDKNGVTLSSAEIFDPVTGEFVTAANLLNPRHSHSTILLSNGKALIVGGLSGSSSTDTHAFPPSAELFDPMSGSFSTTGSLKFKRYSNTTTLLPSGKVLVVGGRDDSNAAMGIVELYDPKSEKFSSIKSRGLTGRFDHSATLLPDGTVLIAGGKVSLPKDAEAEPGIDMSGEDSNSAEIFDPKSGKTIATASLSVARVGHTAIPLSSGNVLMVGGAPMSLPDSPSNNAKRSELYTPSTGKFTSSGTFPASTFGHTATLLANGEVLLAGGFTPSGPSSDLPQADPPQRRRSIPRQHGPSVHQANSMWGAMNTLQRLCRTDGYSSSEARWRMVKATAMSLNFMTQEQESSPRREKPVTPESSGTLPPFFRLARCSLQVGAAPVQNSMIHLLARLQSQGVSPQYGTDPLLPFCQMARYW